MNSFSELSLHENILRSLQTLGISKPTPIQAQAIPVALKGSDVLGTAQTGTGKTFAFSIPMLNKLLNKEINLALILVPTRELAQQVERAVQQIVGKKSFISTALLIGGEPFFRQLKAIRGGARILVGTPGRVLDHIHQDSFDYAGTDFLVIDEADRMLDMGFDIQLQDIIKELPAKRQTLMFSATMAPRIEKLSKTYLVDPVRIAVSSEKVAADNLVQETINCTLEEKYDVLLQELNKREGSVIIFVKTKANADKLARKLSHDEYDARAIHGDLRQEKRERVVTAFRQNKFNILVGTDIVARGLDVPHVMHVINYDLPQAPEDYIHRIGRTARAGAKGFSVCLISGKDHVLWKAIQRLMDPEKYKEERAQEMSTRSRSGGDRGRFGAHRRTGGGQGQRSRPFGERRERSFGDREESSQRSFEERPSRSFDERPRRSFDNDSEDGRKPNFGGNPFSQRRKSPHHSFSKKGSFGRKNKRGGGEGSGGFGGGGSQGGSSGRPKNKPKAHRKGNSNGGNNSGWF